MSSLTYVPWLPSKSPFFTARAASRLRNACQSLALHTEGLQRYHLRCTHCRRNCRSRSTPLSWSPQPWPQCCVDAMVPAVPAGRVKFSWLTLFILYRRLPRQTFRLKDM